MATKSLMSVEEYLRTSFEDGDCEYVDGEIVERTMGEFNHGKIQGFLMHLFWQMAARLGIQAVTDVRIRINSSRYRIPDLSVWVTAVDLEEHGIPLSAPFLAIEILSPEDRMSRVKPKIAEYLLIGVQWVWLIDPRKRTALCFSPSDPEGSPCEILRTENPRIEILLEKVFNFQA